MNLDSGIRLGHRFWHSKRAGKDVPKWLRSYMEKHALNRTDYYGISNYDSKNKRFSSGMLISRYEYPILKDLFCTASDSIVDCKTWRFVR